MRIRSTIVLALAVPLRLIAQEPAGGLRHLGAGISLIYPVSLRWSLIGLAGIEWLGDEAARSPLVRRREQLAGGVGVGYRF